MIMCGSNLNWLKMNRGEVWDVLLDPVKGSEQKGFRPCVIVSPESMNEQLETVIVVPLTSKLKDWPTRVNTLLNGKPGQAICEQIRTVSKSRLKKKKTSLSPPEIALIRLTLRQMLFD